MRPLPIAFAACLALAACSASAQLLHGTSALQGDAATTDGYLKVSALPAHPLDQRLDFWITPHGSAAPIRDYQVEMTKKLHMVVVSDDFKTFLHIHPQLAPSGHFLITQPLPGPGLYHIYADAEPGTLNHQVFRFDLAVGKPAAAERMLPSTGMGVQAGPYEVDLSTVRLHAGRTEMVDVEILRNGKPATDLHPYLGVPAHAVFLNSKDLTYVHVHPTAMNMAMDMSKPIVTMPDNAPSPGELMLHVNIKEAGTYRMWLQFRGANDQIYIAQFTLLAV